MYARTNGSTVRKALKEYEEHERTISNVEIEYDVKKEGVIVIVEDEKGNRGVVRILLQYSESAKRKEGTTDMQAS